MTVSTNHIGRSYRRRRFSRPFHELIGTYKYSKPGLNGLDLSLAEYLCKELGNQPGFFIESGANDGYEQSNTFYLARRFKWTGLLIEPIPELASHCKAIRKESTVIQCALGDSNTESDSITIERAGLMSVVQNSLGDSEHAHFELAKKHQGDFIGQPITVPLSTLSAVIDQHAPNQTIDLLSLDVEGYEPQALRGLDFSRHAPRFICVEANDPESINEILKPRYEVAARLSYHDLLYKRIES